MSRVGIGTALHQLASAIEAGKLHASISSIGGGAVAVFVIPKEPLPNADDVTALELVIRAAGINGKSAASTTDQPEMPVTERGRSR